MSTVGRAEAWHCNADDAFAVETKFIERFHRDEQGKRRVKTTADADDCLLGVDMVEALGKSGHLYVQNLFTGLGHLFLFGNEWMRVDISE